MSVNFTAWTGQQLRERIGKLKGWGQILIRQFLSLLTPVWIFSWHLFLSFSCSRFCPSAGEFKDHHHKTEENRPKGEKEEICWWHFPLLFLSFSFEVSFLFSGSSACIPFLLINMKKKTNREPNYTPGTERSFLIIRSLHSLLTLQSLDPYSQTQLVYCGLRSESLRDKNVNNEK